MAGKRATLIDALELERRRRNLDHKGFSTLLRITESYWCMIRKGNRRPSLNLCHTIYKQVPEVAEYVDDYVRSSNDK